jgi:hypothetical protein
MLRGAGGLTFAELSDLEAVACPEDTADLDAVTELDDPPPPPAATAAALGATAFGAAAFDVVILPAQGRQ